MPAITPPAKVLVSGANGYVACWVLRELLDRGYTVRGTVRAESKCGHLRNIFKHEVDRGKLELVIVSDITAPGAFDEAVKGVDAIEHTASPFHLHAEDPNEIIEPAVKGTVGILESALKHAGPQLKRVVVLSSMAAIADLSLSGVVDEETWNESSIREIEKGKAAHQVEKYRASKPLAEKAALEFVSKHSSEITWDLVTLCPPFVFGPILNEVSSPLELGTSMGLLYLAVFSTNPCPEGIASIQEGWVDVRDNALAHVRAIEVPEAGGQRFSLNASMFIWQDWIDAANALGDPSVKIAKGTPGAGKNFQYKLIYDSAKARTVLGMEFRDISSTTKDIAEDLKTRGWLK